MRGANENSENKKTLQTEENPKTNAIEERTKKRTTTEAHKKVNTIFRIRLEKKVGKDGKANLKNKIQIRAHCMRYLLEYYYYTCGDARSVFL